jgi:hypothetical protein
MASSWICSAQYGQVFTVASLVEPRPGPAARSVIRPPVRAKRSAPGRAGTTYAIDRLAGRLGATAARRNSATEVASSSVSETAASARSSTQMENRT